MSQISEHTKKNSLKGLDPFDVDSLISAIEKSFSIKFTQTELLTITTFGSLCSLVSHKIDAENSIDCTTQQAFYKLKRAFSNALGVNGSLLKPTTNLNSLIPKNGRKQKIKAIETDLGCSLNVLRPKTAILGLFLVIVLGFLVYILQDWKIGCAGFLVSIILFRIGVNGQNSGCNRL